MSFDKLFDGSDAHLIPPIPSNSTELDSAYKHIQSTHSPDVPIKAPGIDMSERDAFEANFYPNSKDAKYWMRRSGQGYANSSTDYAWQGWQARAQAGQVERQALQAEGKHPAPCARFCESTAYEIELRQLKADLKTYMTAASTEAALATELKSELDVLKVERQAVPEIIVTEMMRIAGAAAMYQRAWSSDEDEAETIFREMISATPTESRK